MADQPQPEDNADAPATPIGWRQRLVERLMRTLRWATATRLRLTLCGGVGLVVLVVMFACWSLLAHAAVEGIDPIGLDVALAALDRGRFDDARALVGKIQNQAATPELVGGSLFVLGAVKAHEAEQEPASERRRALDHIAARFLEKAAAQDLPADRKAQLSFLLGRSLVRSGESSAGVEMLQRALVENPKRVTEIHAILVDAFLNAPNPRLDEALGYDDKVLNDDLLSHDARQDALSRRAEILVRLGRFDDARAAIVKIAGDGPAAAERHYLRGRLDVELGRAMAAEATERPSQFDAAIREFGEAESLDGAHGSISRLAMYWTAVCHEMKGETDEAVAQYERLVKLYSDAPEGLAANLSLADYHRREGDIDRAMAGYRDVVETAGDPLVYFNPSLPLADLRRRLTAAYQDFADHDLFEQALTLVDEMEGVFDHVECVQLRARTFEAWGTAALAIAPERDQREDAENRRKGRYRLRAAGVAYEELARTRFATPHFPDDLWMAANCYFRGQSYTSAARVLEEYLHYEARRWNALALLRLGQSKLAANQLPQAIGTFEECIELYPHDAVTYQARLECARAYQQSGVTDKAQRLLADNLAGDALTPLSPEWRDTLFALGRLHYESRHYDEAISKLEEAVQRYPDADATLLAKYTIARAYHGAAEAPAQRLREAKTESERQKDRKLIADNLQSARQAYLDVQRTITLRGHAEVDPLSRALLMNCYMMQGSVLYELRQFEEAKQAYGNVITLYQSDPVVLESFVQVANCWRRLDQPVKARGTLEQAKLVLARLPKDANFLAATNFNRQQWTALLDQMSKWKW